MLTLSKTVDDNPERVVKLTELARDAGISFDQARYAFIWMLDNAFAKGSWFQDGSNANVMITVKGCDEAERLRLPLWRRLMTNQTFWVATVSSIIGGLVVAIVTKALPH